MPFGVDFQLVPVDFYSEQEYAPPTERSLTSEPQRPRITANAGCAPSTDARFAISSYMSLGSSMIKHKQRSL